MVLMNPMNPIESEWIRDLKEITKYKQTQGLLVGGFNPFEKYYIVKMGIFPE